MKDSDIEYLADKPFDNSLVEHLELEEIKEALEQGNKYLHYQFETISRVQSRCTMILGWMFGCIVALIGYIAYECTSGLSHPSWLTASVYELFFCLGIALFVIRGVMYKRTVFFPGDPPNHFFQDAILKPLSQVKSKTKYILGWNLYEVQLKIIRNKEEQARQVMIYRRALALITISILSGGVILCILLLFGV